jgi:hypothetical protein
MVGYISLLLCITASIYKTPEMRSLLSLMMPVAVDPIFADPTNPHYCKDESPLIQEHITVTLLELCSPKFRMFPSSHYPC